MKWKKILKMPMHPQTPDVRDANYENKIREFEKSTIEPALTSYTSSLGAGKSIDLKINVTGAGNDTMLNNTFYIGATTIGQLGNDMKYIAEVLFRIYQEAGYKVAYINNDRAIRITKG